MSMSGQQDFTISYSIVTYPRNERYLDQTIKSLSDTGFFGHPEHLPLRLVGGSPDSSHLKQYLSDRRFLVDPMSEEEAREFHWHGSSGGLRAIKGHRRCLHPFRVLPGTSFLMVMEDDIRFAKDWIPRFKNTLTEIIQRFSDKFLLSLYTQGFSNKESQLDALRSGRSWIYSLHDCFYGVQAVLYPFVVRDVFMYETSVRPDDVKASQPEKAMSRPYGRPHDISLAATMKSLNIPILAAAPCLVQHIGHSSGANSPPHQSENFLNQA